MSRFDERAEATAERQGSRNRGPSRREIRAVRRALSTGHRRLENDLSSINVLLNLIDSPNTSVESGPPPVGSHSNAQAVRFMGRVADDFRRIRTAVTAVQFDTGDKQKFRLALTEIARAWDLRAKALGTADVTRAGAILGEVKEAERRARVAKRGLQRYLPKLDPEGEEREREEREEAAESE